MGHKHRLQLHIRIEPRPVNEVGDQALVWVVLQPSPDPVGVQVGLASARKVHDDAARRGLYVQSHTRPRAQLLVSSCPMAIAAGRSLTTSDGGTPDAS